MLNQPYIPTPAVTEHSDQHLPARLRFACPKPPTPIAPPWPFAQDGDRVTAVLRDRRDGAKTTVRSDYSVSRRA
jgi:hypothetical protein